MTDLNPVQIYEKISRNYVKRISEAVERFMGGEDIYKINAYVLGFPTQTDNRTIDFVLSQFDEQRQIPKLTEEAKKTTDPLIKIALLYQAFISVASYARDRDVEQSLGWREIIALNKATISKLIENGLPAQLAAKLSIGEKIQIAYGDRSDDVINGYKKKLVERVANSEYKLAA